MRNEEIERLSLMTGVPVSEIQKKMAKAGLQDEDLLEKARRGRRPPPGSTPIPGLDPSTSEPAGGGRDGSGDPPVPPSGSPLAENAPNAAIVLARKREAPEIMPRVSQQAPSEGNRRPDRGVEGQRPWFGNSKSLFHRIMRWVLWKITGQKGPNKTSDDEVLNASERMTVPPNQAPGESKGPQRPFAENEKPVTAAPKGWRYDDTGKPSLAPFEDQPKDWWRPEVGVRTTGKGRYVKDEPELVAEPQVVETPSEPDRPSRHEGPDLGAFFRSITESQVALAIRYLSFRKSYGQRMPTIYLSKSLVAEIRNEFSVTTHELVEEFRHNNIEIKVKE